MASKSTMKMLTRLAHQQQTAEEAVLDAEEEFKRRKEVLRQISEEALPTAMSDLELKKFETDDGLKISIKENLHVSIAQERMTRAVAWLRKRKYEKIIKHKFTIVPDGDKDARAVEALLRKAKITASSKPTIHNATLKKFIGELMDSGKEVDLKLFGVYTVSTSKVDTGK